MKKPKRPIMATKKKSPAFGEYGELSLYARRIGFAEKIELFSDGVKITKADGSSELKPTKDFQGLSVWLEQQYKRERALNPTPEERAIEDMARIAKPKDFPD